MHVKGMEFHMGHTCILMQRILLEQEVKRSMCCVW